MSRDDFTSRIEKLLSDNGITTRRYARRGKHRSVTVQHLGKDHVFFFPGSSSDVRAPKNLVAFMRRKLGLRRVYL